MATTPGTIKHRHQSVLPVGTSDVDAPQWNDSEVVAGGTSGDALVRDTTQADGWGWTPLGIYAPLNSPAFTGVPTAPTAAPGTSTTQVATTAFVTAASAPPVWTAVAYSAANFFGTGTMNWSVDAGDQLRFAYLLHGKTLTVSFWFNSTSLTGTATNEIRLIIPAGKTSAGYSASGSLWLNNPGSALGVIYAPSGQTYLSLYNSSQSNFTLSTNTFTVSGTFAFEIT
jgi:hypothetical protein